MAEMQHVAEVSYKLRVILWKWDLHRGFCGQLGAFLENLGKHMMLGRCLVSDFENTY